MTEVKTELLALFDGWSESFQSRIADLVDEELWWEPVPDCWTIRRDGKGGDFGLVFTEEAPFTTLGWRVAHIIDLLKEDRCAAYLGLSPEPNASEEWVPVSAAQARQMVRDAADTFRRYVAATDGDELHTASPRSFHGSSTRHGFVLHILLEVIHHGAEVGVLRDLWRGQQPRDPFVTALLRGDENAAEQLQRDDPEVLARTIATRPDLMVEAAATARWRAIPLLARLGFPIEGSTGRSALHHAAADGNLDLVRLLVEQGANVHATDPQFHAPPLLWAQFFNHADVADYLEPLSKNADGQ